ncbi:uncharacterized protein LOC117088182 isoform X1 [Trachypithecus francoisi]|uniref:uncharacterized protein LOC117088182 isoform X1 n=1 Tax=Trachypithecus francoisi TaxID=54180 RepID=UPI00141A7EB7|nr:uncharacterized protein LOC117088182 isoform X1 [Trachypithecus francoisi]
MMDQETVSSSRSYPGTFCALLNFRKHQSIQCAEFGQRASHGHTQVHQRPRGRGSLPAFPGQGSSVPGPGVDLFCRFARVGRRQPGLWAVRAHPSQTMLPSGGDATFSWPLGCTAAASPAHTVLPCPTMEVVLRQQPTAPRPGSAWLRSGHLPPCMSHGVNMSPAHSNHLILKNGKDVTSL